MPTKLAEQMLLCNPSASLAYIAIHRKRLSILGLSGLRHQLSSNSTQDTLRVAPRDQQSGSHQRMQDQTRPKVIDGMKQNFNAQSHMWWYGLLRSRFNAVGPLEVSPHPQLWHRSCSFHSEFLATNFSLNI